MSAAYEDVIGQPPGVIAIHAGLETGILSGTFPQTEMVSYGPNILGAHSPDERVQISSVQKVWSILQKTLSSIPSQKDISQ
jgi:dipeptidase D